MKQVPCRAAVARGPVASGLLAVSAACAALLAAGCHPSSRGTASPTVKLGSGTLAVLPFATPTRSYFESKVGARLSRHIATAVRTGCPSATVLDVDGILARLAAKGIEAPKAGRFSVVKLGELLGADYVAFGEIHELAGRPPKSFGVLRGKMVVSARVEDIRVPGKRSVVWLVEREKYHYPPLFLGKDEIAADETEEEVVAKKVMLEAAGGIAAVFTGRKPAFDQRLDKDLE
jgi:hypothetical protein